MDVLRPFVRLQLAIKPLRPTRLGNGSKLHHRYCNTPYRLGTASIPRPFSSSRVERLETQPSPSTESQNNTAQDNLTQRATSDSSTPAQGSEGPAPGASSTTANGDAPFRIRPAFSGSAAPQRDSNWSIITDTASRRRAGADAAQRASLKDLFPQPTESSRDSARDLTSEVSRNAHQQDERRARQKEDEVRLRLKPSLGRTKAIEQTIDLQTAIGHLENSCKNNNVRIDERNQKIYVRRGQRKKNLKSLRWRRMFKAGFLQEVGRIQRMRRQGW